MLNILFIALSLEIFWYEELFTSKDKCLKNCRGQIYMVKLVCKIYSLYIYSVAGFEV